jgi:hypothetical protein
MYSVIIPTMWMVDLDRFKAQLLQLNNCDLVSDIVLIDNNPNFPMINKLRLIHNLHKINHIKMNENIFVNPAWNIGVKMSIGEYIILLNDDLITNPLIVDLIAMHDSHFDKDIAVYGMNETCYPSWHGHDYTDFIKEVGDIVSIKPSDGYALGWGCMIIMNRKLWVNIPDGIKIWFGDNFISDTFHKNKLPLYSYWGVKCTEWSQTIRKLDVNHIIEQDKTNYKKILNEIN